MVEKEGIPKEEAALPKGIKVTRVNAEKLETSSKSLFNLIMHLHHGEDEVL